MRINPITAAISEFFSGAKHLIDSLITKISSIFSRSVPTQTSETEGLIPPLHYRVKPYKKETLESQLSKAPLGSLIAEAKAKAGSNTKAAKAIVAVFRDVHNRSFQMKSSITPQEKKMYEQFISDLKNFSYSLNNKEAAIVISQATNFERSLKEKSIV